eukprot:scaffold76056_cov70-Phaeocystis_antarctica.AAC.11
MLPERGGAERGGAQRGGVLGVRGHVHGALQHVRQDLRSGRRGGAGRVQGRCMADALRVHSGCTASVATQLCSGAAAQWEQTCGSSSERATPPTSVSGGGPHGGGAAEGK